METAAIVQELRKRGLLSGSSLGYHSGIMDEAADIIEKLDIDNKTLKSIVEDYAANARVVALFLDRWFDQNLRYDEGIADAARKAEKYIRKLEEENEKLKKELSEAMAF